MRKFNLDAENCVDTVVETQIRKCLISWSSKRQKAFLTAYFVSLITIGMLYLHLIAKATVFSESLNIANCQTRRREEKRWSNFSEETCYDAWEEKYACNLLALWNTWHDDNDNTATWANTYVRFVLHCQQLGNQCYQAMPKRSEINASGSEAPSLAMFRFSLKSRQASFWSWQKVILNSCK